MERAAEISPCGAYRYWLTRKWSGDGWATFVMLNPSTADALVDDATIRKCVGFAQRWGRGGIKVVNLFAFRATEPKDMKRARDPFGPDNWNHLELACRSAMLSGFTPVCAWGANGNLYRQDQNFLRRCSAEWGVTLRALRITAKSRAPEHPLYIPYETQPVEFA